MSHGEGEVKISILFGIKNSVSFSTDKKRYNFVVNRTNDKRTPPSYLFAVRGLD